MQRFIRGRVMAPPVLTRVFLRSSNRSVSHCHNDPSDAPSSKSRSDVAESETYQYVVNDNAAVCRFFAKLADVAGSRRKDAALQTVVDQLRRRKAPLHVDVPDVC